MKRKKGFTLIEIIAVIGILGVIIVLVIPHTGIFKDITNKKLFESKKELILDNAILYAQDKNLENDSVIYVSDLIKDSYIEPDDMECNIDIGCVYNPVDNSILNNVSIKVKLVNNNYSVLWEEEVK